MTCIVGVQHDGKVTIGGDSAGVTGDGVVTVRSDRKVWATGPWAFGFTSSFRMGQLLRYRLDTTKMRPAGDLDRFMVTKFVDHVRDAFNDGGWLGQNPNGRHEGGVFMVGCLDRLYVMYSDFQIEKAVDTYNAVGSGQKVALGALYAIDRDQPVRQQIKTALAAAAHHMDSVVGPFHLVSTQAAVTPAHAKPSTVSHR